jgi:ADP-ribose pyrophosphatase YjhB (NUDIX family)
MYDIPKEINPQQAGISGILGKLDESAYFRFVDKLRAEGSNPAKVFAIAVVLINPRDESKFLAVKRPPDARTLPDVWGLPAITIQDDELLEAATFRLAKEKLNTQVEFLGCLGFASANRGEYELTLMDVVARLVGKEPSVWEAPTERTKYVQQQWTNKLALLTEAALKGSVCSSILLRSYRFLY